MNQDQLKSLLTLCGGNNSSAKDLNIKVDPQARALHMDVITPNEVSRYLRAPTPEYAPPQEVTEMAKQASKTPVNNVPPPPPTEVAEQPREEEKKPPTPQQSVHYNIPEPQVLLRIAIALERIADVLEERFPEITFEQPKVQPEPYPESIELASKENRILDDDPNA